MKKHPAPRRPLAAALYSAGEGGPRQRSGPGVPRALGTQWAVPFGL